MKHDFLPLMHKYIIKKQGQRLGFENVLNTFCEYFRYYNDTYKDVTYNDLTYNDLTYNNFTYTD